VRLLIDQDVYAVTSAFLKGQGHDVVLAKELGMATASDEALLERAGAERRIMVTRDADYGHLVFVRSMGPGVIRLAITPDTIQAVHRVLAKALAEVREPELFQSFLVIEADRYRLRKPS
jgi:predicted nuclease of predicted toxin-antitoxin system